MLYLGAATDDELRALGADEDAGVRATAAVDLVRGTGDPAPLVAVLQQPRVNHNAPAAALLRRDQPAIVSRSLTRTLRPLLAGPAPEVQLLAAYLLLRAGDPTEGSRLAPAGLAGRTHVTAEYGAHLAIGLRDPALEPALRWRLTAWGLPCVGLASAEP